MALKSCLRLVPPTADVPQIAEFPPGKALAPQIRAVLTGIARRTAALFMVHWTIGFISDDSRFFMSFAFLFFMRFAFLLITVDNDRAFRHTGTPDHAGTPNHTQAGRRAGTPDDVGAPNHAVTRDKCGTPDDAV
jgi:hypothetical protein